MQRVKNKYVKSFLGARDNQLSTLVPMYHDNQASIHIATNLVFHEQTEHEKVVSHYVQGEVSERKMVTPFELTTNQLENIFTNLLDMLSYKQVCPSWV